MEYRRATSNDIEAFVQNRIEFFTSIRNIPDVGAFEKNTKKYLTDNIDSDAVIFIAVENGKIVSSCMACIFQTAPLHGCLNGKNAELLNVYTKEAFRRKGHVKKLLELLIDELKYLEVEKVLLEYTSDGLSLYEKMGFVLLQNQMQLYL